MRTTDRRLESGPFGALGGWRRALHLAGIVCASVVLFGSTGCVSPSHDGESGGTDWSAPSPDADTNTGGDGFTGDASGDTDDGEREPVETTFTMKNDTDSALFIRQMGPCAKDNSWLSLRDGQTDVLLESTCTSCSCEALRSGSCAVCDIACPPPREYPKLAPGASKTFEWNGVGHRSNDVDGRSCQQSWVPPKGTKLTAEFCSVPGPTASGTPDCKTVEFSYGEQTEVSATFEDDREPVETTFKFNNDTSSDVYIRPIGECTRAYPWVSLRDGDRQLAMEPTCQVCSCSDARSGLCGVCAIACREQAYEKLEAGETKTYEWSGIAQRVGEVDGQTCHEKWIPPQGRELEARFCTVPGPTALGTPDCETVTFRYGEQTTVRKRVGSGEPGIETSFRLQNDSDSSIRVERYEEDCSGSRPAWAEVHQDGSAVKTRMACGECRCSSIRRHGSCPPQDCICNPDAPDRVLQLDPGEDTEWTWSGNLFSEASYDGQSCYERRSPSPGTSFTVEYCWEEPAGDDVPAFQEVCETEQFYYGEAGTVTHRVD